MADRPILFSAPMVRALLAGTKTQTRRAVKTSIGRPIGFLGGGGRDGGDWNNPECWGYEWHDGAAFVTLKAGNDAHQYPCPYGAPGDRLWVREAWRVTNRHDAKPPRDITPRKCTVFFEAGGSIANQRSGKWERDDAYPDFRPEWVGRLRHGMFMPRWASRLTLELVDVRVERLQDISEKDARAEGSPCVDEVSGREVLFPDASKCGTFKLGYRCVWEQINGLGSWDANPWVWVVEFKLVP